ncbi:MAG: alpha-L-fucosidase [Planctomycetota bacterium]|jgi:alpha-L-fucosidase
MRKNNRLMMLGSLFLVTAAIAQPYEPTWESLSKHKVPEWFRDAKFGIYTHWGPVTVGAEDGPGGVQWYGRNMYVEKSPTFEYHRRKYGDQNEVGYKDMVKMFRTEKFDAEDWAELFAAAGAKFAGPVAIHHDNYAMWDSKYTIWDSVDQSPRRDFVAALERSIRSRGMKFIATFHHAFAWQYFEPSYKFDAADGKHAGLYCEPHEPGAPPTKEYLDKWLGMVNEVVEKYEPDLTWFDFGLSRVITLEYRQRMFADYYNWATAKGVEVGVAHKHRDIHEHTGIIDFERGREDRLTPYPWLTDTSVGPWFHQKSSPFKTVDELVDVLVDIVSKNGCMLLNVGPRADGTIPEQGRQLLLGIGDWLEVNGEAIYGTRPWLVFGEGPTRMAKGGGFSEKAGLEYTSRDIRFTQSKDGKTVYVIILGRPEAEVTIRSMKVVGSGSVEMVGNPGTVEHHIDDSGHLVITPPVDKAGQHAFAFRLTGFQIDLHPDARFAMPGAATLEPGKATLEGVKINTRVNDGRENIGFWDNPAEKIHWLVWLDRPGSWRVRGEFSCAGGPSGLRVTLARHSTSAKIPRTDGWFRPVFVDLGRVEVDEAGVYQLTLEPADAESWKAVNVYRLQVAPAQ